MKTETHFVNDPKLAEVKLTYSAHPDTVDYPILSSPSDIYQYTKDIWEPDTIELREEFVVILLNNSLKVLGWSKISVGSRSATVVEIPHIVLLALLSNASSIVCAHNHPSGTLRPSTSDKHLTTRIDKALSLISIKLEDHLIITREGYFSFKEHNLL